MHDKEIRCCLKRYLARRVLRFLNASVEKLQLDRHRRVLLCERPAIMVQLCETGGMEPGSPRPRDHDGRRPNGIHEVTDEGRRWRAGAQTPTAYRAPTLLRDSPERIVPPHASTAERSGPPAG